VRINETSDFTWETGDLKNKAGVSKFPIDPQIFYYPHPRVVQDPLDLTYELQTGITYEACYDT
jgi:hypothetical protein